MLKTYMEFIIKGQGEGKRESWKEDVREKEREKVERERRPNIFQMNALLY